MRIVYFYLNRNDAEKIKEVVPRHVQYWQSAEVAEYQGGPFSDRSGGLIIFQAANLEEATHIIQQDPFVLEDMIAEKWIKSWIVE